MTSSILLNNIPLLIALGVNCLLAILVWKTNPKNPINQLFTGVILTICLWILSLFFLYSPELNQPIVFWGRVAFGSTNALGLFLFIFAYHFPAISIRINKTKFKFFVVFASIPILLACTPLIIRDVRLIDGGPFPDYGSLFGYSMFAFLTSLVLAFILLIKKYKHANGYAKAQLLYIFWGFACTVVLALCTNLIVPTLTGNSASARLGPIASLVLIVFATYSIVRYRFLDIQIIIRRGMIYSLLLLSIFLTFSSIVIWLPNLLLGRNRAVSLIDIATLLTLTLFIAPLQRFFEKITDRYFFKARYNTQYTIYELGRKLSGIVGINELEETIVTTLCDVMKIRGMTILRIINDTESIWGYGSGRQTIKEMKKRDLQQIIDATKKHGELLVVEETSRATRSEGQKPEHWLERLETAQIALVTPLVSKGKLIGILFIDGKRSNDAFSSQDIELLDILAHQAAVAFDNAMLYSELEDRIRRRTAQLEDANKHLVKLDKAKTEFLSIASHQLRTPLSAIRGYISLLEDGDYGGLNEQQHGVLKKTDDNIRRLVSLVNDLLSLARIEAGTGPKGLNLTTEDFCSLVDVTVDELAIKAKNKGLEILWTRPEGRVEVELDKERMGQVVMNLIDNALNYTLKGRVTVGVDEQKDKVIFRVQDTGIGMDPETLGNLFTKFFRSQDAIKVKPDGSGIGLYVCKILVEAHEGTIAVTSTKDMGTAFTVELLKKCSARKTADPLDPVLQATQPES